MSDKKRKANSMLESRHKKKQHAHGAADIEHTSGADVLKPIIANTPGANLPQDIHFKPFSKKENNRSTLLIHSSEHPTIDYTAIEGSDSSEAHLKHYVAVYDPATNRIQLTEATRLTVRASVRQPPKYDDSDDENTANLMAPQSTRVALTEAFGSKKSKKAVQSMAENRQLGQGVDSATIAEAITGNLSEDEKDPNTLIAAGQANKPLPIPNLHADDIEEVYSLSTLVVPRSASQTLKLMPINTWMARFTSGKEVKGLRVRFVSNRVSYIGKRLVENPQDQKWIQQLQLLQYINLLAELAQHCGRQDKRRKMDFMDEWPENALSPGFPPTVVKPVLNRFFPDNTPSQRAMTLLRTTIFALTLHILPPSGVTGFQRLVTEPSDIQLDLAMEGTEVKKLYHEIGCTVKPAIDKDLAVWGYTRLADKKKKKEDGTTLPKPVFAVLRFPLDFPKISTGRRPGARR